MLYYDNNTVKYHMRLLQNSTTHWLRTILLGITTHRQPFFCTYSARRKASNKSRSFSGGGRAETSPSILHQSPSPSPLQRPPPIMQKSISRGNTAEWREKYTLTTPEEQKNKYPPRLSTSNFGRPVSNIRPATQQYSSNSLQQYSSPAPAHSPQPPANQTPSSFELRSSASRVVPNSISPSLSNTDPFQRPFSSSSNSFYRHSISSLRNSPARRQIMRTPFLSTSQSIVSPSK